MHGSGENDPKSNTVQVGNEKNKSRKPEPKVQNMLGDTLRSNPGKKGAKGKKRPLSSASKK